MTLSAEQLRACRIVEANASEHENKEKKLIEEGYLIFFATINHIPETQTHRTTSLQNLDAHYIIRNNAYFWLIQNEYLHNLRLQIVLKQDTRELHKGVKRDYAEIQLVSSDDKRVAIGLSLTRPITAGKWPIEKSMNIERPVRYKVSRLRVKESRDPLQINESDVSELDLIQFCYGLAAGFAAWTNKPVDKYP